MALRNASRVLTASARKFAVPSTQWQRHVSGLCTSSRPSMPIARTALAATFQHTRGVKTLDFCGTKEIVHEHTDWPVEKLKEYFKDDTIAVLGFGSQGRAQSLNLRDNGLKVILGLRKDGPSWKSAIESKFVVGETLFDIEEAISRGSIICNLLSDAAQCESWPIVESKLTEGKTLYFSHGFSPVFKNATGVKIPPNIDVVLVAPKCSGVTLRKRFIEKNKVNSSVAVYQDITGNAKEKSLALGVAVGSGCLYETTFEKEVYSDLCGERGSLMGGIHGLFLAQYEVLRERGHSPSEAFNETVEEATESLYPLIGKNGMDYMYAACSTTARRGAIDWTERFRETLKPVFNELYDSVIDGTEAAKSIAYNRRPDYREAFEKEMEEIRSKEIWKVGSVVRDIRARDTNSNSKTS